MLFTLALVVVTLLIVWAIWKRD